VTARHLAVASADDRADANGTTWRLRALAAMGHDSARIARALAVSPSLVRRVASGQALTVTTVFRGQVHALLDAWWDKTPPLDTAARRRTAARTRRHAQDRGWPAAAGLDDEQLDQPGYRPWCRYRPAAGTGTAADFPPPQRRPADHEKDIA
jgi:hypothetical protein